MMQNAWNVITTLNWLKKYLADKNIPNHTFEAEQLLAHILDCARLDIYLNYERPLSNIELKQLKSIILKRVNGQPISHITHKAYFWNFVFKVDSSVLTPRRESEHLLETVLTAANQYYAGKSISVLDLGTGSGVLAICLSAELPQADITATDISTAALNIAKENLNTLTKLSPKVNFCPVNFLLSDMFDKLSDQHFDIIITNPPYIPQDVISQLDISLQAEPKIALSGGADGLNFYRQLASKSADYLNKGGLLAFEHGFDQKAAILDIFSQYPYFKLVSAIKDFSGNDRVMLYHLVAS